MKSFMASPSTVERKWYVVDAEGKTLGRLASEVANETRVCYYSRSKRNASKGTFGTPDAY